MNREIVEQPRAETLAEFIERVEQAHFRTDCDTGANECAMLVWNLVRKYAGKPRLRRSDLRSYCAFCNSYHVRPLCLFPVNQAAAALVDGEATEEK